MRSSNYLQCLSFRPCKQKTNKQKKKNAKIEIDKENFLNVPYIYQAVKKTTGSSTAKHLNLTSFEVGNLGFGA